MWLMGYTKTCAECQVEKPVFPGFQPRLADSTPYARCRACRGRAGVNPDAPKTCISCSATVESWYFSGTGHGYSAVCLPCEVFVTPGTRICRVCGAVRAHPKEFYSPDQHVCRSCRSKKMVATASVDPARSEYRKQWLADNQDRVLEYGRRAYLRAKERGYKRPPTTATTRICSDCKTEKPLTERFFTAGNHGGFHVLCKLCNRERARGWRSEHPERVKLQIAKRNGHPEKQNRARAAYANRKARKLKSSGRVSAKDLKRLFNRFAGLCAYCNLQPAEHVDHVVPLARGGSNSIGNLLPACARCNQTKHTNFLIEWKRRLREAA